MLWDFAYISALMVKATVPGQVLRAEMVREEGLRDVEQGKILLFFV